ncbi:hypothetical protein BDU57DRAFT_192400 [Ampelomyces quisqualis]|uniref:Uncharacterized protein n=1 Tax=Ampelomyces quisqualis TaxID=50730 RepID=A0A6A5QS82_AMPQU|nr:hypothetical protein BDU57DRAFT_192400 [Ampelomyces quisqualis]
MEGPFIPDGSPSKPSQISREDSAEIISSEVTPPGVSNQHVSTSEENLVSYTPPGSPLMTSQVSYQNPHTRTGSKQIRKELQLGSPFPKSLSGSSMPSQTDRAALPSQLPKNPAVVFEDSTYIPSRNLPRAQMMHLSSPQQPPVDNLGRGLSRQHHLTDDKVESAGNSSATLPRQHKRNKTTVSDFADMLKPMKVDGQSTAGPSRELFESNDLGSNQHPIQSTSSSWQLPEARQKSGHQRVTSEDSIDSSLTVASDSWNPVEDYIASSADETLSVSNAMSLFNFGTSFQSRQESDQTPDPAQFSWVGLRDTYALSRMELAGHNHGVAVYDAAYVTGKIPETEEEWTTAQLAPGFGSTSSAKFSITYDSNHLALDGNKLPADDAMMAEKGEDLRQDCSMPVDDKVLLQPTVYEPPDGGATRVIAEDAGSISDYANDSDGDEVSTRAEVMPRPSTQPTAPQQDANGNNTDVEDDMIRGDLYFPTIMPSPKSWKQNSDATGQKRKRQSSFLKRISAHFSKLTPTKVAEYERGRLNRDFKFPSQDRSLQLVAPGLGGEYGEERMSETKHKRYISFGGVMKIFAGRGGRKYREGEVEGEQPCRSFLRRQVARLDDFLVRRTW